ncbi:MAG: PqqD family peptide modification chaperone [Candidatus Methanoperedens sp.]|nr:PqqD family peptide modification chaperone [Candidatus Methanoperedens sp.]
MLTRLVFPPQWIPTQPYLSLPSLTAFLKASHCSVEQMDANISFYDTLLSKQGLHDHFERVQSRFQELDSKKELLPELQGQYAALSSSMLFGEYVINEVEDAKRLLRNKEDFYDIEELFRAFKLLELGLKLASSAYYPTNLTFHSYDMRYSCRSSREVLSAVNDREENLFIDYFEKNTVPALLRDRADLIGISIINTSQLIPGLTLANLIKKADKEVHINIGGSVFTRLINEVSRNKELFSVFDSVIVHEGETALLSLIKHLDNELEVREVPNLIYRDGDLIRMNRICSEGEDINSLPAPCFDGFPLDAYFSPELILPVLSSRGCYWKRCTFCDHGYGYSGNYRPRSVELLYNDLETLKSKYKTGFFTFQDEGVSTKLMSALSDRIISNKLGISWLGDSRFEPSFSAEYGSKLSEAGCRMLYFGLESANERVLKCMDKGIKKEDVLKICRYSTEAGIWTHLFLIFGFPTETREEARETMDFILQNRAIIRSMSFGSFQLTKHSKVYETPSSFEVGRVNQDDNIDISLWYDYETASGMSKKETDALIQGFYNELSLKYRDFPVWSNLDREHLFLYISHYKRTKNRVPQISMLIDRIQKKQLKKVQVGINPKNRKQYLSIKEGVFVGTFNFNLAQIIHDMMAGSAQKNGLAQERVNVLFDTNNNRVFTVTDFARDILEMSRGESKVSEIVESIKEKYKLPNDEAESKCKSLLQGLMDRNIIYAKNR